jgi:hypothetical protein
LDNILIGQTQSAAQCRAEAFQSERDIARVGGPRSWQMHERWRAIASMRMRGTAVPMRLVDCCTWLRERRLRMQQRVWIEAAVARRQWLRNVGRHGPLKLVAAVWPHSMHIGTGTAQQVT